MPEVIPIDGRTLYAWVVDLGPAETSGSRQTFKPVEIRIDDILDWSKSRKG